MEQMMGVKEGLPAELAARHRKGTSRGRVLDAFYPPRAHDRGLAVNRLTLNRRIDAFYARLDRALAPPARRATLAGSTNQSRTTRAALAAPL
jgi:hypothetical protein